MTKAEIKKEMFGAEGTALAAQIEYCRMMERTFDQYGEESFPEYYLARKWAGMAKEIELYQKLRRNTK